MKNTLIIGLAGAGKTRKLKEILGELPNDVRITLCENTIEDPTLRHNDTFDMLNEDKVEFAAGITKMLIQKPSILVIEELDSFNDIADPYDIPVFATMQVATKEEAVRILTNNHIDIEFEEIISL